MSDDNKTNVMKAPLGIANKDEYFRLKEENGESEFYNEGYERLNKSRCCGHRMIYVCDYIGGTVSVVDIVDSEKLMEIKVGDGPLGIDISEDNKYVYVTNFFSNTLSVINTGYNKVVETVKVGDKPAGVRISKNGHFVYVVHYGEPFVYVLDRNELDIVTKIPLPSPGFQIDITEDGTLAFVTLHNTGKVAVVDLEVNLVVKVFHTGSGAEDIKISPVNHIAFVSNEDGNDVTPINIFLAEPATTNINTGKAPVGLAFGFCGRKLYVANRNENTVSVIDIFSHKEVRKIEIGKEPYGAASIDEKFILVSNFEGNSISVIDSRIDKVVDTINVGRGPTFLVVSKE